MECIWVILGNERREITEGGVCDMNLVCLDVGGGDSSIHMEAIVSIHS